jgi:hypothetical protein
MVQEGDVWYAIANLNNCVLRIFQGSERSVSTSVNLQLLSVRQVISTDSHVVNMVNLAMTMAFLRFRLQSVKHWKQGRRIPATVEFASFCVSKTIAKKRRDVR